MTFTPALYRVGEIAAGARWHSDRAKNRRERIGTPRVVLARMRNSLFLLFVLSFSMACSSTSTSDAASTSIHASDYDPQCVTADDCVAITEGSLCGCTCDNAAINVADLPRESADARDRRNACPQTNGPYCGVCSNTRVHCDTGRCTLEMCIGNKCASDDAGADAH